MNQPFHAFISSVQNDRVKGWASLLDKKNRDKTGQFLIEGVHLILEAFKSSAAVRTVIYDDDRGLPKELSDIAESPEGLDAEWIRAARPVMAKCSDTDTPPPVFAVVDKLPDRTDELFREGSLVVVLDGVRDPGNVGTIIRSADAVGADAVLLGKGSVDLYNPKVVRSTMGSLFHLPIVEADLLQMLPQAGDRGIKLVGTSLRADHSCYGYDWKQPTWLLMGNESNGLSASVRELMDESVIIPMRGEAESLNVAMATTVLLFEAARQRQM
ncbi:RNA methyltransferase [Paenibacillus sp. LHD-117]|uniref:TrmH family RNA methyltransferase n=1 Tax=Paenibacillus sp. LHD-117 TaxID=3071412 RepID=UPI0027E1513E|nr:RNA methyltransferase [Paenibacillus sp. LHD-117]MDQ6420269.1 RNA methyltransferase [Paenibacillus sp. LHD-117]